jgi:hypothetical protein
MSRLGTITFQANDRTDVFLVADVLDDADFVTDESLLQVNDPEFEIKMVSMTGSIPKMVPVNIEGGNVILQTFFKGEEYVDPFIIRVYIELEEAEELLSVEDGDNELEETNANRT